MKKLRRNRAPFPLEKRTLKGHIKFLQYARGFYKEDGDQLFSFSGGWTRKICNEKDFGWILRNDF